MKAKVSSPIVLMYHGIRASDADLPPGREPGSALYDVGVDMFRRQMDWLCKQGVFVSSLVGRTDMEGNRQLVLTFDDGEMNNFTVAWPVLKACHFPAYFFVTASRIGQPGYMNWDQLRELQDNGMSIGSHGMRHQILTGLSPQETVRELQESKRMLEENMHITIDCFSIPRGFVNRFIVEKAREAGYRYIFTSRPTAEFEGCVGRVPVKASWSMERFRQAVDGETPWPEIALTMFKDTLISILGAERYDRWRTRAVNQETDS